jgi:amphi-Trp domain-containing protein
MRRPPDARRLPMELIEHVTKETLRREEAADRLRHIADELARNNDVTFVRDGVPFTVHVPDEVEVKLEVEVGDKKREIEVELKW